MDERRLPKSLWAGAIFIIAALLLISGRTAYDVYALARIRDDLAMSRIWADAVWCNVAIWIVIGLPLLAALQGWKYGRFVVAGVSLLMVAALVLLMRWGHHTPNPWAFAIALLQIAGTALLFLPRSSAYFRPATA